MGILRKCRDRGEDEEDGEHDKVYYTCRRQLPWCYDGDDIIPDRLYSGTSMPLRLPVRGI